MKYYAGVAVAVFGAEQMLSLRRWQSGRRAYVSVCLYDQAQGWCHAALRETALDARGLYHAQGPDFVVTFLHNGDTLDVFGNMRRFDGETPILFDVVLSQGAPMAGGFRYACADGRVVHAGSDILFSLSSSCGIFLEMNDTDDARLCVTPRGLMRENSAPPVLADAQTAMGRLFARKRLHCAAGYLRDKESPGQRVPYIVEKTRGI